MSTRRYSKKKIAILILIILIFICAISFFVLKITKVTITGNTQNTQEQIEEKVFTGKFAKNTMMVFAKKIIGKKVQIPFVDKYELEFESPFSIKIIIYEKNIVGYIKYMGNYMYFDKDGIMAESSSKLIENIPMITGMDFSYAVEGEKLPVSNDNTFNRLLNVTKLIKKYNLSVSKISIEQDLSLSLYMGDVIVELGNDNYVTEKMSDLNDMSSNLADKKGTLLMHSYDEEGKYTLKVSK